MAKRWEVYQYIDNTYTWHRCWIARPPGASFEDSFSFGRGLRGFDHALNFATHWASFGVDHG